MADPGLRHDRDAHRGHDPLDHRGIAHPGNAAGGADVRRDALERHDGDGPGVLRDLRVVGRDDVHDDAALEHLGEALLRGPGGRFDGHVWQRSLIWWAEVPGATDRGVMPALGRAVARARGLIIAEGPGAPGRGGPRATRGTPGHPSWRPAASSPSHI